jgi:hypothetical protein
MIFVVVNVSFHDHIETIRELLLNTNLSFHGIRKKNNKIRLTLKNGASKIIFIYKELIYIQKESPLPISMFS